MDRTLLERKALAELREIASALELRGYQRMKKADLVDLIIGAGGGSNGATPGDNGHAETPKESGNGDDRTRTRARARRPAPDTVSSDADSSDADSSGAGSSVAAGAEETPSDGSRREHRQDTVDAAGDRDRREAGDGRGDGPDDEGRRDGDDRQHGGDTDRPRGEDRQRAERGDDDLGGAGNRNRNKRERRRKSRGQGQGAPPQENLEDVEVREGVLDLLPEGYGFLRVTGYLSGSRDVYVSQSFVRRFDLRRGDKVGGPIRRNKNNDKFPALARVDTIEGRPVGELDQQGRRPDFKDLTPLFATERLRLEHGEKSPIAMRLVDMMAPIGKGQRGLIVSPPKAGKTTVLKQLAAAIEASDPDLHLMVVLVDERPEEVTDFQRSTTGEVISSTFDRPAEDHTQVAELTIERAKRLAERGKDVVILLDSITRLGRAYNLAAPASGRIMSGGIDSAALYPPKRFFGAARNIEEGGSLTIIATALIETGSKMDEVIFEEFKGTGNMELRLDRRMEQKRIFPAIDIQGSGTRREELLLDRGEIDTIWKLRRLLSTMDAEAALTLLIDKLKATRSNEQFLQMIQKSNLQ
jgi:transcription termination factor Rho